MFNSTDVIAHSPSASDDYERQSAPALIHRVGVPRRVSPVVTFIGGDTMSDTKKFPARVLLTVTTGRLLTKGKGDLDNGIADLYELLGWMTNDSPYTHQLGRFSEECKPHLLRMFPELEKAESDEVLASLDAKIDAAKKQGADIPAAIESWLAETLEECGIAAEYDIPRIPAESHEIKGPIPELSEMIARG